jgi:glycosyltransferase involved in cell wall biosynthesis
MAKKREMKILFLTTQLPYPPVSGGLIKTWNLVKHWSEKADLMLIFPLKDDDEDHLDAFRAELPQVEIFSTPLNRGRNAMNLIKSYFLAPSLNIYRNAHPKFTEMVKKWTKAADLIFIDHYEMGQYIAPDSPVPVIFHEHNAEYVMWERLAKIQTNPIKKFFIKLEAKRIKRTEKRYADLATKVLAAPNDMDELERIGVPSRKMHPTYHLGEDHMLDLADIQFENTKKSLLFIGTLTWEANIDGLLWFLREVYPRVLKKESDTTFKIVGKNPDQRLRALVEEFPSVELTGFVEDPEPLYGSSRVFVIPLRFGSGIKVKLLNAMYRGLPTVTTPIGTEGLEVDSGIELFSSPLAEEQAEGICRLLTDKSLWEKMRDRSREKAGRYSWDSLLRDHDKLIEDLVDQNHEKINQREINRV